MFEGRIDLILARIIVPKGRNRDSASHGQFFKVALVSIPADDCGWIAHRGAGRLKCFEPCQKLRRMIGIVPDRAEQCEREFRQLLQRSAPVQIDHLHAARSSAQFLETGAQGGDLMIMLEGIGTAIGGARQCLGASKEGNFHDAGHSFAALPVQRLRSATRDHPVLSK